ncbi:10073_t:CDS:2 [Acaulospora colombiana]|uniref:10073_t:CDS:1 n=1 Tax=Acaulospora colombiana TaxID=27376 RepID=A0ACA9MSH8_9GLOM|nr:10073_t:CDS:2 [Acaulospora colombiana]
MQIEPSEIESKERQILVGGVHCSTWSSFRDARGTFGSKVTLDIRYNLEEKTNSVTQIGSRKIAGRSVWKTSSLLESQYYIYIDQKITYNCPESSEYIRNNLPTLFWALDVASRFELSISASWRFVAEAAFSCSSNLYVPQTKCREYRGDGQNSTESAG